MASRSSRFAIRWVVVGAFFVSIVVGALGCTADPASWLISFSGGVPSGTVSVHAEIRTGSCEGAAIFTDDIAMGEGTGMTPSELADGTYYFYAEARSANCGALATGCTVVTVPITTGSVAVQLLAATAPPRCEASICNTGVCGQPDAGQMDLGVDLGRPDLGPPPDFGMDPCTGAATPCGDGPTAGLCRNDNCCPGCWDGTVCWDGTANIQCGDRGAMCTTCAPTGTCVAATGMCMTTPTTVVPQPLALSVRNSFVLQVGRPFASAGSDASRQRGTPRASSPGGLSFEEYSGGVATFVAIAATQFSAYGLTAGGQLYSWGTNSSGLLGTGSSTTSTVQAAPTLVGSTLWRTIDGGDTHVCAIAQDGRLACWGNRADGRIGVGATVGTATAPVFVDGATNWSTTSAGLSHSCATKSDGSLWCWGYNGGAMDRSGQLGLGNSTSRDVPTQVGTDTDWASVSAGNAHTCAIKAGGSLYCWGEASNWGRLGLGMGMTGPGDSADVRSPVEVTAPALTWASVTAGQFHTCGIASGGALYCWGVGYRGGLGLGGSLSTVDVPTMVSSGWAEVAVGWTHTCGIRTDDSVLCWGQITDGRTGTGVDPTPDMGAMEPDIFVPTAAMIAPP